MVSKYKHSYPSISPVHVLSADVSRHSEVCYFTRQIVAQQNIPGRQITVNYLKSPKTCLININGTVYCILLRSMYKM